MNKIKFLKIYVNKLCLVEGCTYSAGDDRACQHLKYCVYAYKSDYEGKEAPELCPACNHPQAYFEVLGENW